MWKTWQNGQAEAVSLTSTEASEIGQGLVQIVHETNVLPPIKDLGKEVVLTSTTPVTGGNYFRVIINASIEFNPTRHLQ